MGIEPTRAATPKLENKRFCATTNPKCDGRVNFRGMWGYVGLRRDTSVGEIPVRLADLFRNAAPTELFF
jgi:hypothetical protein